MEKVTYRLYRKSPYKYEYSDNSCVTKRAHFLVWGRYSDPSKNRFLVLFYMKTTSRLSLRISYYSMTLRYLAWNWAWVGVRESSYQLNSIASTFSGTPAYQAQGPYAKKNWRAGMPNTGVQYAPVGPVTSWQQLHVYSAAVHNAIYIRCFQIILNFALLAWLTRGNVHFDFSKFAHVVPSYQV
jgi:hypothetical protein